MDNPKTVSGRSGDTSCFASETFLSDPAPDAYKPKFPLISGTKNRSEKPKMLVDMPPGYGCYKAADILRDHFRNATPANNVNLVCDNRNEDSKAPPHFFVIIGSSLKPHVTRGIHTFEVGGYSERYSHTFLVTLTQQVAFTHETETRGKIATKDKAGAEVHVITEKMHEGRISVMIYGHPIFHPSAQRSDPKILDAIRPRVLLHIPDFRFNAIVKPTIERFVADVSRMFTVEHEIVQGAARADTGIHDFKMASWLATIGHCEVVSFDSLTRYTALDKKPPSEPAKIIPSYN